MEFRDFAELEKSFCATEKKTVAVCAAQDESALFAVQACRKDGLIDAVFVGDKEEIERVIARTGGALDDLNDVPIIYAGDLREAAEKTCACVRAGEADFILKGKIDTAVLLKAAVSEKSGLRTGRLMNHLAFLKIPNYHKLIVLTDSGMVLYPDLTQKKAIIENAVESLRNMGYTCPKVGVLAAVEKVTGKQPETVDAEALAKMSRAGEIKDCIVEGPLSYDILMSKKSAEKKAFESRISGDPDILVVPNMPCGNILGKALVFSAEADMAGIIVGAKAPIALTSRGATEKEKRHSILLAAACAEGGK